MVVKSKDNASRAQYKTNLFVFIAKPQPIYQKIVQIERGCIIMRPTLAQYALKSSSLTLGISEYELKKLISRKSGRHNANHQRDRN